jgi:small subunit ribosomal protein S9
MTAAKKDYLSAVGRRKRSVARVRLIKGKGQMTVNAKSIGEYFKDVPPATYLRPLELTGNTGKYYVTAKIAGGGRLGQVGAFVLGLSRALVLADEKYKSVLRPAGLLTRDPRERERRKFGLAQGARARKQSPKR